MRWWMWLGLFIAMGLFLVFIPALFALIVFIITIYYIRKIYYWWYRNYKVPPGHRIRHGLLRSHLETQYGKKEGDKLYKETVSELKKKGYY